MSVYTDLSDYTTEKERNRGQNSKNYVILYNAIYAHGRVFQIPFHNSITGRTAVKRKENGVKIQQ